MLYWTSFWFESGKLTGCPLLLPEILEGIRDCSCIYFSLVMDSTHNGMLVALILELTEALDRNELRREIPR